MPRHNDWESQDLTHQVNMRLHKDDYEKLRAMADSRKLFITDVIREIVKEHLNA